MDLGSGITFDIFTHDFHGFVLSLLKYIYKKKEIQCDNLEDGYNGAHLKGKTITLQVSISVCNHLKKHT